MSGSRAGQSDNSTPRHEPVLTGSTLQPFTPNFVSHKQVEAHPIAAAEFDETGAGKVALKGGAVVSVRPGFASRGAPAEGDMLVRYEPTENEPDGYLSHSPRAVFDAGYRPLPRHDGNPPPPLNKLSMGDIQSVIVGESYHRVPGTTFMVCFLTLRNGFIVTGESACADPSAYDQATGEKYARENAVEKIWTLEGYLLRERLSLREAEARGQDDAVQAA